MKLTLTRDYVLISLFICACQKNEKTKEQTTLKIVKTEPKDDNLIRATVTNKEGVQMAMAFNNATQTATFIWQGKTVDLKQVRMASGIKYSNADYEFTEH